MGAPFSWPAPGLLHKAWRDIIGRRIRTALTLLAVVVGVSGLVAIVTTAQGFLRAQREAFDQSGQADIQFWVWNAPDGLMRSLSEWPSVASVGLRLDHLLSGRIGGHPADLRFIGILDWEQQPVNRLELVAGRWPALPSEGMVEPEVVRTTGLAVGDTIAYRDRVGREQPLTIVGVARQPTTLSAQITGIPTFYVPATVVRNLLDIRGNNQLMVRTAPGSDQQVIAREIATFLDRRGLQHASARLRDPQNFPGKRELDALFAILYLFAGLGLVLSAFLVGNTLSSMVAESAREIGIMKAIGATSWEVLVSYLAAAAIYGVVGTAVGVVIGIALGNLLLQLLGNLVNLQPAFTVEPLAVALGPVVGLGVTLLAGTIPAWQAAQISVKSVLESYGLSRDYGQGRLDQFLRRLQATQVPALGVMAARNLLRRKARSFVTITVIVLAVAALLGAGATNASITGVIDDLFGIYLANGWALMGQNGGQDVARALPAVDGIEAAEGWLLRDCWAQRARARCWGMPPTTRLYRPLLLAGRWLDPADPMGVAVSEDLAQAEGLQVGDALRLQIGTSQRRLVVRGIVQDHVIFLGSNVTAKVFVPLPTMAAALGDRNRADIFALTLAPAEREAQEEVLLRMERRFAPFQPSSEPAAAELEAAEAQTRILTAALQAMVILVTIIGAIGLLNTLALNVLERRREIGVLRALGSDDGHLLQLFLFEGLTLGLIGWLVGLLAGWLLGRLFVTAMSSVLFQIPYRFPLDFLGGSLAFALFLSLLASVGPAMAAARLPAAEALRYE